MVNGHTMYVENAYLPHKIAIFYVPLFVLLLFVPGLTF